MRSRDARQTEFEDLNCLTTSVFEQLARDAGLRVERREAVGGNKPVRTLLTRFRMLQDLIAAYFVYELVKPQ